MCRKEWWWGQVKNEIPTQIQDILSQHVCYANFLCLCFPVDKTNNINKIWICSHMDWPRHFCAGKMRFQATLPPLKSNNQLPDQLAFSVKSHAVCTKPELHIIEGDNCCLAVVWSCSLTDWLPLIHTHTWTVITNEHIKTHKEWVTLIINTHATHALVFLVPFRAARVHPSQNNPSPSCRHSALSLRLSHSLITL